MLRRGQKRNQAPSSAFFPFLLGLTPFPDPFHLPQNPNRSPQPAPVDRAMNVLGMARKAVFAAPRLSSGPFALPLAIRNKHTPLFQPSRDASSSSSSPSSVPRPRRDAALSGGPCLSGAAPPSERQDAARGFSASTTASAASNIVTPKVVPSATPPPPLGTAHTVTVSQGPGAVPLSETAETANGAVNGTHGTVGVDLTAATKQATRSSFISRTVDKLKKAAWVVKDFAHQQVAQQGMALIEPEMSQLNNNINVLLSTNIPVLEEISRYYFSLHGKRLRPALVLLMAQSIDHHLKKTLSGSRFVSSSSSLSLSPLADPRH